MSEDRKAARIEARRRAAAAWRHANPEKVAAAKATYRAANKKKISEYNARYRVENKEAIAAWYAAHPRSQDYLRAWRASQSAEKREITRAKNAARSLARSQSAEMIAHRKTPEYKAERRAWRLANPEKVKAYGKRKRALARTKERQAAYRADPERKARRQAEERTPEYRAARAVRRAIRYADPMDCLKRRMSTAVRSSLRNGSGKFRAKWIKLVGYTAQELRNHIERQFLPKMGWHNFAEWHVDHIVPLASFNFSLPTDADFKAAWALTNLRPIWAVENLRKHAKREFLV